MDFPGNESNDKLNIDQASIIGICDSTLSKQRHTSDQKIQTIRINKNQDQSMISALSKSITEDHHIELI